MQLQQSEQRIKKLETEYDNTHNAQTLSEIRKEITNYNTLADEEIKYISRRHTARKIGEGGRPSRNLAQTIRTEHKQHTILCIEDDNKIVHHYTAGNLRTFMNTYGTLYNTQDTAHAQEILTYIADIALIWLTNAQREYLVQPITEEEIHLAIKSLPNGKSPGPDGYTGEFYKAYSELLSPHLIEMYDEAYNSQILPPTL